MKTKVYLAIAVRLIILFGVGMMVTFITPHMREFFGDVPNVSKKDFGVDSAWDWGARHYWYFWLMVFLFILSLINFVMSVINIIEKNYDTKKW